MARLKARERRNKLKQGCRRQAQQCKEACVKYELDMAEYNKKKSEQEAKERHATRMHNSSYDKIQEVLEELNAVSHPNEEQERLRKVLRSKALRAHDGKTRSRLLARSASHR
jgi:tRNA C32,U32 (ribose-2'-O)-methylase TrmJ